MKSKREIARLHLFRIAQEVAKNDGAPIATAAQIAGHLGITVQHLTFVVAGVRQSPRVMAFVDPFIALYLGRLIDYCAARALAA